MNNKKMDNLLLSMDISLTATGIAVLSLNNKELVYYDVIITKKTSSNIINRYDYIINFLKNIFSKYNITKVAIEGYSYGSVGNAKTKISELTGIIKYFLFKEFNIIPVVYPPTTWKKVVTGNGNSKKETVMEYIEKIYNIKLNCKAKTAIKIMQNISDAIGVGYCFLSKME